MSDDGMDIEMGFLSEMPEPDRITIDDGHCDCEVPTGFTVTSTTLPMPSYSFQCANCGKWTEVLRP